MKILVADDDGGTRKVLKSFLTQLNYETQIVENGVSALEVLKAPGAPHIAIIDWMMPDMEGLEVCRQIRALEPGIDPYVMILTAKKEKADIAAALDAGADDVLSKPFNILEMSARLRVAERSIRRQLRRSAAVATDAVPETGPGGSPPSTTVPSANEPVAAPTDSALAGLTVKRSNELVLGVLGEAGVHSARAVSGELQGMNRSKGFTIWSGFVLTTTKLWLDVVMEIDDASADAFFSQLEAEAPSDQGQVMTFLKKIHTSLISAIQGEINTQGSAILSPFSPVGSGATTLRLPEEFRRLKYSFRNCTLTVTFAVQSCPLQLKRPDRLLSQEILAESYPKLRKEEVTLLNQGAVLNARFIDKIVTFDLSTDERQLVPVFQPSPMALDFLAMGLVSNARG